MNFDPCCQAHFAMWCILFCCCPIKHMRLITRVYGSLVPRSLPDFISQLWRKWGECLVPILHHGLEMVDSVSVQCGLSFVTMATCPRNMRPIQQRSNSTKSINEGCVDVSGRHYVCTSTEESSRFEASASLRVKIWVCTRATIVKEAQSQG